MLCQSPMATRLSEAFSFKKLKTMIVAVNTCWGMVCIVIQLHPKITGRACTGQMLCIVDTSLSVLMTLRMCLRELCCLFTVWI